MGAADIDRVAQIEEEVFTEPWSKESFLVEVNTPNHIYLVAEESGNILGYCGMWEVAGEGQITNVCVAPEHRGKRVATQMLEELLNRAAKKKVGAITLEVRVSNEPAIRLYENLGFEVAGIRRDFYSHPNEDAKIMWRY
jgi:ribosomal-protein-alanine N-acetyltransferase